MRLIRRLFLSSAALAMFENSVTYTSMLPRFPHLPPCPEQKHCSGAQTVNQILWKKTGRDRGNSHLCLFHL
jgi:hypothetical protein